MKTTVFGALTAAALLLSCSGDETESKPKALPVSVIQWNASGAINYSQILYYDSMKRISSIAVTEANTANNRYISYTYEAGKVTRYVDYNDPAKTDTKYIHYYENGESIKDEFYIGTTLDMVYFWMHSDGIKTATLTKPNGERIKTFTYTFNSKGNCVAIRVDEADPTKPDSSMIFENYDKKTRAVFNHFRLSPWSNVPGLFKSPLIPNNPGKYTHTPDGIRAEPYVAHEYTYEYNADGTVAFQRTLSNGALLSSTVYEYSTEIGPN